MIPGIEGRVVAIGGAAIGIGKAIAARFHAEGARVHGCDILAQELPDLTRLGVAAQRVDLADRAAATAWIREIERVEQKPIDILVCNAGGVAGQGPVPLEEVSDAAFDRVVEVNLGSTLALCRAAIPGMKRVGRGAIVTISSGAALQASLTGVQAYCAAKHAVLGLTRQMSKELGRHGIRVNSVAPGFVLSESTAAQWQSYDAAKRRAVIDMFHLGRLGTAEEIAGAVLFMASDLASLVTGQVLAVDGGR